MFLLGIDIGSSSVKVALVEGESGKCVASAFHPKKEMKITAPRAGWAEQDPEQWWKHLKRAMAEALRESGVSPESIGAVGISYQMHGLVVVDKALKPLRPAIIWCDSRAVEIGDTAFEAIGKDKCLATLLNSPGNFTASKLKWIKDNEPDIYNRIYKIMLPGDYIAMKLTGEPKTTVSGLSEGIFWDFERNELSREVLDYFGFDESLVSETAPTFGPQGTLPPEASQELGLAEGTKVCYRAGDQPNNAFSLNVMNPGEVAATAGTSGVVYGISDRLAFDRQSRVNTFAHVNHRQEAKRLGVLLCVNGTGILNSWLRENIGPENFSYEEMNALAERIPVGAEGMSVLPFGNGAERILNNRDIGAQIGGTLNFNIHTRAHLFRAAQEGIAFAFKYGMEIMAAMGTEAKVIRAGHANMFLSPIFRQTLASVTGASIELYDTDGAVGAARGAGIGAGYYKNTREAFRNLKIIETVRPDASGAELFREAYGRWTNQLAKFL
ncbi:carbohydrate kinase [Fulvitalea axinellae]|uniref:Carbohydrate kinase n=1 Tax=Fulvitalea axinellae TaxID=1182444 RepID=A0AAU9CEM4_9BACT|nr:carbohydrate kinase [Fulvitalea axinellae]